MKTSRAIAAATIGIIGTLVLGACGTTTTPAAASMTAEATALTALGFTDSDVTTADNTQLAATAAPSASPGTNGGNGKRHGLLKRLAIRRGLARNIEHGSITVQTKTGDQTIDVQRGVVTAITSTSVSLKSTDGYTATWTFGSPIRVIDHRSSVQPSDVVVGETVGVAGVKAGSTETASLMVIPNPTTK